MKGVIILRNWIYILSFAFLFSACSDGTGPRADDLSGEWSGTIQHPGYDGGSFDLNINQEGVDISGSYSMRLVKAVTSSRTKVENYGGLIADGNSASITQINFNIIVNGSNWTCAAVNINNNLTGSFETLNGITGTFQLSK